MAEMALVGKELTCVEPGGEMFVGVSISLEMGQGAVVLAEPQMAGRRFLQICATTLEPNAGQLFLFGNQAHRIRSQELLTLRRRIAWVHRDTRLISNMSILDNLTLGWMYHGDLTRPQAFQYIKELVDRYDLMMFLDRRPAELSYDKQRLVVYVRELAKNPNLLVLENPVTDLSDDFDMVKQHILELTRSGETAFIVSGQVPPDLLAKVAWVLVIDHSGHRVLPLEEFDPGLHGPRRSRNTSDPGLGQALP